MYSKYSLIVLLSLINLNFATFEWFDNISPSRRERLLKKMTSDPPHPSENKPYYHPNNYTVSHFHRLVNGHNEVEWDELYHRVQTAEQNVSALNENVTTLQLEVDQLKWPHKMFASKIHVAIFFLVLGTLALVAILVVFVCCHCRKNRRRSFAPPRYDHVPKLRHAV